MADQPIGLPRDPDGQEQSGETRPRAHKRFKKPLSPAAWFFIIVGSSFLSATLFFLIALFFAPTNIHIPIPGGGWKRVNLNPGYPGDKVLLVMGVDINPESKDAHDFSGTRTDTMMLVRLDVEHRSVSIVSIPRDSKVYFRGGRGIGKINAAYAIGGEDMAVQTVQSSFGIPVDNYVVINLHGVREMVDAMGGIGLHVEQSMRYRDRTAKLDIDFKPGYQVLNGEQAEGYLRFRHDALGDIGRVRRQQQFLSAISHKMKDPMMIPQIPALVSKGMKYVHTDLSTREMLQVAWLIKDVDLKNVRVATLPGRPSGGGISYWIIDTTAAQQVLDKLILNAPPPRWAESDEPMKIGVFYPPDKPEALERIVMKLDPPTEEGQENRKRKFKIVCKTTRKSETSQIIEHTLRTTNEYSYYLRSVSPALKDARLIFAPVGTTFESNACSGVEDYTIILGNEA